jgi:hypothetical protein
VNYCRTCKYWHPPSWDTGGFGTCYLPSTRRDNKLSQVIRGNPKGSWIGTHKMFGCVFHSNNEEINYHGT